MCGKYILCTFLFSPLYTVVWWTLTLHFNVLAFINLHLYSQGVGSLKKIFFSSKIINYSLMLLLKLFNFVFTLASLILLKLILMNGVRLEPHVISPSYPRIMYSKVHSLSTNSSCYPCGHTQAGLSGLSVLNHWSICLSLW